MDRFSLEMAWSYHPYWRLITHCWLDLACGIYCKKQSRAKPLIFTQLEKSIPFFHHDYSTNFFHNYTKTSI